MYNNHKLTSSIVTTGTIVWFLSVVCVCVSVSFVACVCAAVLAMLREIAIYYNRNIEIQ